MVSVVRAEERNQANHFPHEPTNVFRLHPCNLFASDEEESPFQVRSPEKSQAIPDTWCMASGGIIATPDTTEPSVQLSG